MSKEQIPGGFYIKARKIDESDIAHCAPCVREVWDYLIRQCNHKDNGKIKRGQCVRRIADIQEALHWKVGYKRVTYSKSQCERALNNLRKMLMIATTKTTRGMLITVCNYDVYNDVSNYERNSERVNCESIAKQWRGTINKNDKNDNNSSSATPEKIFEMLRRSTSKEFPDWQIEQEANKFFEKYGNKNIANIGALINKWASNLEPETLSTDKRQMHY